MRRPVLGDALEGAEAAAKSVRPLEHAATRAKQLHFEDARHESTLVRATDARLLRRIVTALVGNVGKLRARVTLVATIVAHLALVETCLWCGGLATHMVGER